MYIYQMELWNSGSARVRTNLCYLISLRHLIKSRTSTRGFFSLLNACATCFKLSIESLIVGRQSEEVCLTIYVYNDYLELFLKLFLVKIISEYSLISATALLQIYTYINSYTVQLYKDEIVYINIYIYIYIGQSERERDHVITNQFFSKLNK